MISNNDIDWNDVIKKEARGPNDDDCGKVKEILREHIITLKGNVSKYRFYFPQNIRKRFQGETVYFKITKDESKEYKRDH